MFSLSENLKTFFFVPRVILDRFGYPESIFRGRKSKIIYFFTIFFLIKNLFFISKIIPVLKKTEIPEKQRKSPEKNRKKIRRKIGKVFPNLFLQPYRKKKQTKTTTSGREMEMPSK